MAEAALATVGAVGSVVQLGDAALRLCRSISDFIGELQDAKNDMRHLRSSKRMTSISTPRSQLILIVSF